MKPEPSEVTCRGAFGLGPRKFLNSSSSGEPGGNCGIALCIGAFRVWLVEMFTTVGSSLSARSAKESGAGRAKTADGKLSARNAQGRMGRKKEFMRGPGSGGGIGRDFRQPIAEQTGQKSRYLRLFATDLVPVPVLKAVSSIRSSTVNRASNPAAC